MLFYRVFFFLLVKAADKISCRQYQLEGSVNSISPRNGGGSVDLIGSGFVEKFYVVL